jgi:hypothetical protein
MICSGIGSRQSGSDRSGPRDSRHLPWRISNSHCDQGAGIPIEIAIEIGIEILCLSSISIPIPISIWTEGCQN